MIKEQEIYDIVVIGGGSAGMMAAGRAAERGTKVILLERNKTLGRKILLTGNGRCNITTQANFNNKEFIKKLGKNGPWFFSALAAFGSKDIMEFFAERGLKIKIEEDGRVFPFSDHAQDV